MTKKLFLIGLLFLISCSSEGINGPDVLTKDTTIKRIRSAKLARLAACGGNVNVQALFVNDSIEFAGYTAAFYSEKDVSDCTLRIFSVACGQEVPPCNLSSKSAFKGSFLQGEF
ncbi:hypothetical protein [Leptospira idonii]|uniref:TIGR04452 family lipoprotein n=1 Tax=Leptospira idonii TaxID=1193500 RepID=A0A4V3JYD1_9LEPT|nr:hypothetical protein [Leptospira idonii]TGN20356.1 hypothetical protein EHS15_03865 [Leptospira idonii]